MKRDRSNDGHKYSRTGGLPIRPELLASLIAEFSGPRKISAPKVYHGPKAAPGHPPVKLTDDQVLTLRKMRDWHGMSKADIAKATGLSDSTISGIVDYKNRVHLDPGPRPVLDANPYRVSPNTADKPSAAE